VKLVIEAIRSASAQPVSSIVTALIVGGVCAAILSTTGQTVQAERSVLGQIDAAGTRSVIIADTQGNAGITADAIDRIGRLSGVEWGGRSGSGLRCAPGGQPRCPAGGGPDGAWRVAAGVGYGTTRDRSGHRRNRRPAGTRTHHTVRGVAGDDAELAMVGIFDAAAPLEFLNRGILTRPASGDDTVRTIHILATESRLVSQISAAALAVLAADDPSSVSIETSAALAAVRAAVQGELGRFGRQLVTMVLAAGLVLTGLNVYGSVTTRRKDFGRRRALGASRPMIITLIGLQTAVTAAIGAAVGSLLATAALIRITDEPPDLQFALAIAMLAIGAAIVAAIPPASSPPTATPSESYASHKRRPGPAGNQEGGEAPSPHGPGPGSGARANPLVAATDGEQMQLHASPDSALLTVCRCSSGTRAGCCRRVAD
jgi:putative ABC transport system permease protein